MTVEDEDNPDECVQTDPMLFAINALVDLMDELENSKEPGLEPGPPKLLPQAEVLYEKRNVLEDLPPPQLDLEVKQALETSVNIQGCVEPILKNLYVNLIKEELVPTKIIPLKNFGVKVIKEEIPKQLVVKLARISDKELATILKSSSKPEEKPNPPKIICKIRKNHFSDRFWNSLPKPKRRAEKCFVCKKDLEKGESLNLHLYRYHPVQLKIRIRCPKCSFRTSSKLKFLSHMKRRHINKHDNRPYFYCKYCSFKSRYKDSLKDHQRKRECKHFTCHTCGFVTKHRESFRIHQFVHASDKQLKCPHCTYKGRNHFCLDAHMAIHRKKSMPCNICQKMVDIRFMANHVMSHSLTKKDMLLRCHKCDYRTLYDANYRRHLIRHKREADRKYKKCNECDYKTTDAGNLKRHYQYRHSPDFRWKCELCDFATNHHNSWNHHKEQHKSYSERKKLKCPHCTNEYLTLRGLGIHIVNEHKREDEVKTYKCKFCEYSTRVKQSLKVHVRIRHESHLEKKWKEEFQCLGCPFKSKTEDRMEAHIREHQKRSEPCEYEVREKELL